MVDSLKRLLIATHNEGKLSEVRQLLSELPFSLLSLRDFPETVAVQELGFSFEANAELKAAGYASQAGMLTLADDSGLEVDALAGAPGVLSARYAGKDATDRERVEQLLAALIGVAAHERSARFVSAVAIADCKARILHVSVGKCEGTIALSPRGKDGFGYDPIFVPEGHELTFAELGADIKNQISHRAHALVQTRKYLTSLTHRLTDG